MSVSDRPRPALRPFLLALAIAAPGLVSAQTPPDAGSILRDIQSSPPPKHPVAPPRYVDPGGDEPVAADLAVRVRVHGFRISGAALIPSEELLAQIRDLVGRELSLLQLKLAARRLAEHYRARGFLARVYLPPQTIEDGIVEFRVVEARLGEIGIGAPRPARADAGFARRMLLASQQPGEPVRTEDIMHGLRVINETPGFSATAVARPGAKEGKTDLLLKVEDTPLLSGLVMLDNHGAETTGAERTVASLNLNNPGGGGDQATLMVLGTSGNFFTRLGYAFPVGDRGTRVSLASTGLSYELGGQFASLKAEGLARIESVALSHPLRRTSTENHTLTATLEQKRFINNANQSSTSDKFIHLLTLGASGERRDGPDEGGAWQGSVALSLGKADLGLNANDLAADQSAARTHGHFAKLAWSLGRTQPVGDRDELALRLSGQWADGNLDSGEKFSLGGPTGVRAYPVGEASADEGWIASVEWRRKFGDEIQAAIFLDAGGALLHKHPWSGWDGARPGQPNHYMLNGVGAYAAWKRRGDFIMTASWTMRLGSNPGADARGSDNDGTRDEQRLWWQLTKLF